MKQNAIISCCSCSADMSKDMIALNKKMLGRKVVKFFCLNCMANFFDVTTGELLDKIQEYKDGGCTLFK